MAARVCSMCAAENGAGSTFDEHVPEVLGRRPCSVVICVVEQNWKSTQKLPSTRGERTVLSMNAELIEMVTALTAELTGASFPT